MDSYIYRTTKKEHEAYIKWQEDYDKNQVALKEYEEELKSKYGNDIFEKKVDEIVKIITVDELNTIRSLIEETHKEYDTECEDENYNSIELYYWRKPYGLHRFIVRNFNKNKGDNCVRIVLTKENIQTIIDEMIRCDNNFSDRSDECIFGTDDYWDRDDLKGAIKLFKNILKNEFSDDSIIYYYSWY